METLPNQRNYLIKKIICSQNIVVGLALNITVISIPDLKGKQNHGKEKKNHIQEFWN